MDKIAKGLEADGILTGAGKTKWWSSTINKILRNEKYIGDALLQKTYTTDFLSKTRVKNNGIVPQYYVEGNHEAIIPKEIFLRVQEELVRRRVVKTSANGKKRSYSCNHCFAQIVICSECGEMFRRIHWNNRGCKSIVWRCLSRLEPTGEECHARTVNETQIFEMIRALAEKNQKKALDLYYDLLSLKEPPMRILFLIARQFNQLLLVKSLAAKGYDKAAIASRAKIAPFVAGRCMTQARSFTTDQLKTAVQDCVQAEEDVKTGKITDTLSVELLIMKYSK